MARARRRAGLRRAPRARPLERRAVGGGPAAAAGPRPTAVAARELPVELPDGLEAPADPETEVEEASGDRSRRRTPRLRVGRRRERAGAAGRSGRRGRARRSPRLSAGRDRGRRGADHDRDGLRGDRGDHLVHEHLEPDGDGRRGAAGTERGRARAARGPDRQDVAGARLQGRDGLPRGGRADGPARDARVRAGGLRLHDMHRQLGAARHGGRRGDRGERPGRRGRALGQPQLRGPDPSARAGRATSPRRRWSSRSRSPVAWTSTSRPSRSAPGPTGGPCSSPTSGRRPTRSARSSPTRSTPSCSGGPTRSSSRATSAGGRCRSPRASGTPGTRPRPTSRSRRSSMACRGRADGHRGHHGRARAGRPRRLRHHRPHLPRRLDLAVVARRPVAPGARRRPARVQLLRRAARPARGHGPRHVREHPAAQRPRHAEGGAVHGPSPVGRRGLHLRHRDALHRRGRAAARSSPAANTARARRATGRPRGRCCSGSRRSSPRATSGSTAPTWSAWACCRCSSSPATARHRSG